MIPPNENWLRSDILIQSAIACGAEFAVISPGSRNTPLSHSAIKQNELKCFVNIDERSAAFTALGMAKATCKPVLLICTSGTAAANYYPAIVEANLSRIPLMVITSDRPAHLQNRGAPQTIGQTNLYGSHVKSFMNVPEKINDHKSLVEYIESITKAFRPLISKDCGPIHINSPFDEPLQPIEEDSEMVRPLWNYGTMFIAQNLRFESTENILPEAVIMTLLEQISKLDNVYILAGPGAVRDLTEVKMFKEIIECLNVPVFADIASGVRHLSSCVKYPDLIHAAYPSDKYNSGTIIWFGGYPTSKRLARWLTHAEIVYRIQDYDQIVDPDYIVKSTFYLDINSFDNLVKSSNFRFTRNSNFEDLNNHDDKISSFMRKKYSSKEYPLDMYACTTVVDNIPSGANLVLANSMPIRYVDNFCSLKKDIRVFANKGANGIDGTISTAAGIAIATGKPTILIIGDLAFLHDINALAFLRNYNISLTIILLNNNGGGIFHYLPAHDVFKSFDKTNNIKFDSFESIQGTPQNVDFAMQCEGFGIAHYTCREQSDLSILKELLRKDETKVVEVFCDRNTTHQYVELLIDEISKL